MSLQTSAPAYRTWTPEEEARLEALVASGLYVGEVARSLSRSQQAVQARANRLGLRLRSAPMRRAPEMDNYSD